MVESKVFVALAVAVLGCVAIPVVAFILVRRKSKNITGALFAGVLSFVVMQLILRIQIFLPLVQNSKWLLYLRDNQIFLYALFFGFTAGLFETVGRYLTLKLFIKDKTSYYTGISHGIGQGGIEAIMLVGLTFVNYLVYSFMINAGTFQAMIEQVVAISPSPDLVREQYSLVEQLLTNPMQGFGYMGLLERFLTIFIHIGLSVMVAEGIVKGKGILYSIYALILHAAIDTFVVMLGVWAIKPILIEGIIALFAAGLMVYVFTSKKRFAAINKVYPVEKEQASIESDY